jgi:hypothetical protein
MPLEGQWARRQAPLGRAERRALRVGLVALVAGAVALPLAVHGSSGPAAGCIEATVPSTTGGALVRACGDGARRLCATPGVAAVIRERCRHAGLT